SAGLSRDGSGQGSRVSLLRPQIRALAGGGRGRRPLSAAKATASKATARDPMATPAVKKGALFYLIDGSGYIFRAYHALPPLTRKSDGLPTGAVQGFCNMLWKLLKETRANEKPTHLAVIFDESSK